MTGFLLLLTLSLASSTDSYHHAVVNLCSDTCFSTSNGHLPRLHLNNFPLKRKTLKKDRDTNSVATTSGTIFLEVRDATTQRAASTTLRLPWRRRTIERAQDSGNASHKSRFASKCWHAFKTFAFTAC